MLHNPNLIGGQKAGKQEIALLAEHSWDGLFYAALLNACIDDFGCIRRQGKIAKCLGDEQHQYEEHRKQMMF